MAFFVRMLLNFAQKTLAPGELKINVIPLLTCLVAGVFVTNFRKERHADEFSKMCKSIAPYVYCSFFTLVGATINFQTERLGVAGALAGIRVFGVLIGSFSGGGLAGEPWRRTKLSPMNYVTQAGVALGFAEELKSRASEQDSWLYDYGGLGDYIYTVVAMVVVCNQIIGPPLYKLALRYSGDAFIDRIGGATLVTVEGQTPQIQIKKVSWEVRAGVGNSRVAQIVPGRATTKLCRNFDKHQLPPLLGEATTTGAASNYPFICMLEDDEANFEACRLAQRLYGTRRFIVQQNDPAWKQKFNDMGGLVLDPDAIVVEPLQQFLGSAQSAPMLLHLDPNCEVVRVFVDQVCSGMSIAQVGLPKDVQVLEIRRHKLAIVPRAFTKIQFADELMLCGNNMSLADVTGIKKGRVTLLQGRRKNYHSSHRMSHPGGLLGFGARSYAFCSRLFRVTGVLDETSALFQVSAFEDEANAIFMPGHERFSIKKRSLIPMMGRPSGVLRRPTILPGKARRVSVAIKNKITRVD